MKYLPFISSLIALITIGGCNQNKNKADSQNGIIIEVSNISGPSMSYANADTLYLQTPEEIVMNSISTVRTTPTRIIVSDLSSNVYGFDREGNFICQYSRFGESGEEYLSLGAVTLTPENDVAICDGYKNRMMIFDLDGSFKSSIQLGANAFSMLKQADYVDDHTMAITRSIFNDSDSIYAMVNLPEKEVKAFAAVPEHTDNVSVPVGTHSLDLYKDTITYIKPFDPVIYMYPEKKWFDLKPDQKVWNKEQLSNIKDFSIMTYATAMSEDIFLGYTDIFQLDDYIFLGCLNQKYALIDKSDWKVQNYDYQKDDDQKFIGINKIIGKDGSNTLIGIGDQMIQEEPILYFYTLPSKRK